ncbi:Thioredoxin-like protein 1 [Portunus trituberculatus]|uniref:Thioredoxin-like protein 1 n=1 Tax=Portunus trituberculatus TaxID=210409 RepID=A0A5B7ELE6_PORTR|nr:Thioredoxin-like protein 1 [Portunus trituberculatus]
MQIFATYMLKHLKLAKPIAPVGILEVGSAIKLPPIIGTGSFISSGTYIRAHITTQVYLWCNHLEPGYHGEICGPCQRIAPVFEEMAHRFPNAVFLKIDVNQCPTTSASQGVTAAPTFIFFRNKTKLDSLQGADPEGLEARIRQHYGDGEGEEAEDSGVPGHYQESILNQVGTQLP